MKLQGGHQKNQAVEMFTGAPGKGNELEEQIQQKQERDRSKRSQKSNDTAKLSFSLEKSDGEGHAEAEITITGTGTNENGDDNDIDSNLTSPSQHIKAQMPAVKTIKTKTISQVCQQETKTRVSHPASANILPQSQYNS